MIHKIAETAIGMAVKAEAIRPANAAKARICPIRSMIRPRSGSFRFTWDELNQMHADIDAARGAGLEGVVLGAELGGGALDVEVLRALCERASDMGKTLHRVVDLAPDRRLVVDLAVELGFDCILSSGGALQAVDGVDDFHPTDFGGGFSVTNGTHHVGDGDTNKYPHVGTIVLIERLASGTLFTVW